MGLQIKEILDRDKPFNFWPQMVSLYILSNYLGNTHKKIVFLGVEPLRSLITSNKLQLVTITKMLLVWDICSIF